jgi:hypothetical protein
VGEEGFRSCGILVMKERYRGKGNRKGTEKGLTVKFSQIEFIHMVKKLVWTDKK